MVDLDELERLEREATPTDETRALVDEIESQRETIRDLLAALDDMIAELRTLRARVVELEEDRQAERDRVLGARVRELARQHHARTNDPYGFARAVMRAMEETKEKEKEKES